MLTTTLVSARVGLCFLAAVFMSACATSSMHTRSAIGSARVPELQAGLTPDQWADVDKNCLDGAPVKTSETFGPTEMVYRGGYVLEHSSTDKIPLWVCEGVDKIGRAHV